MVATPIHGTLGGAIGLESVGTDVKFPSNTVIIDVCPIFKAQMLFYQERYHPSHTRWMTQRVRVLQSKFNLFDNVC